MTTNKTFIILIVRVNKQKDDWKNVTREQLYNREFKLLEGEIHATFCKLKVQEMIKNDISFQLVLVLFPFL